MMVNYAAHRLKKVADYQVYDQYQILGDDLILFDSEVALEYLKVCQDLGVSINLKKSVVSETKSVVEFAKRTALCGQDVSALSWKELLSNNTFFGRLDFFLKLVERGFSVHNPVRLFTMINLSGYKRKDRILDTASVFALLNQYSKGLIPENYVFSFMNNDEDQLHYFGKYLSSIDRPGLKLAFRS